jgi:hypothetical protein
MGEFEELSSYHARHAQIASSLMRVDPQLSALEAFRLAVPIERRLARKLYPWWGWAIHAVLLVLTGGKWALAVTLHVLLAWQHLHSGRYPARPPRRRR